MVRNQLLLNICRLFVKTTMYIIITFVIASCVCPSTENVEIVNSNEQSSQIDSDSSYSLTDSISAVSKEDKLNELPANGFDNTNLKSIEMAQSFSVSEKNLDSKSKDILCHIMEDGFYYTPAKQGEDIYSLCEGTVIFSGDVYPDGKNIIIEDDNGNIWRFKHLKEYYYNEMDKVSIGDLIGKAGCTGNTDCSCILVTVSTCEEATSFYKLNKEKIIEILKNDGSCRIKIQSGEEIKALCAGTVIYSKWESGYGKCLIIEDNNGCLWKYQHLADYIVSVGDYVECDEPVAHAGKSGFAENVYLSVEYMAE